ncbi:hypothetical protein OWM07_08310 [Deferribacter thermophilus]|uniref:hypothetical protein n=1 Tax=Deferribacter thermophilus TaxID=53573 RepID=UPI003C23736F
MKVSKQNIVIFDDSNYEFICGYMKNNILYPIYAVKDAYSNIDDLIKDIKDHISESKNKYLTFIYCGSELLDKVEFINKNIMNIPAEILKRFKNTFEVELKDYLIDYSLSETDSEYLAYICGIPKQYESIFTNLKNVKLLSCFSDIYATSLFFKDELDISLKLNVRDKQTIIFISSGENILFTRGLNIGYNHIIEKISIDGGVPTEKVIDYLENVGVDEYETDEMNNISSTIRDNIDRISLEIQRTLDYYNRYINKGSVNSINIIGRFNRIKAIEKYYNKLFNMKVIKTVPENYVAESNFNFEDFDYLIETLGAFKEI